MFILIILFQVCASSQCQVLKAIQIFLPLAKGIRCLPLTLISNVLYVLSPIEMRDNVEMRL